MSPEQRQESLKRIPPITELLKTEQAGAWLNAHPAALVTECLRQAAGAVRQRLLEAGVEEGAALVPTIEGVLARAAVLLVEATRPRLRAAVNATGIILHTGLGRAVFPESVVDSIQAELKGYATLAVDPQTGERVERDELVEPILKELTGAEAATVVNNNAAGTMLLLAALAAKKEVIVSRGELIEIGGSFRLPEVMAQSQARLVEVGSTNRTHLRDYANAITSETAAILRVHPSNYRVVGFTSAPPLAELVQLAHQRNVLLLDDLGAGALVGLEHFGLPHEPTVSESVRAGADVVLFSGDKLIGASQAGVLVGRKELIARLRKHPLMRAMRVDKTCLLVLERTLHLFRNPEKLKLDHPTYRMICTPIEAVRSRAETLVTALSRLKPQVAATAEESVAYVGSGSLPTEAISSFMVTLEVPALSAEDLARQLRLDEACVFGRIEADRVRLDMRTLTDTQVPVVVHAVERVMMRAATASAIRAKGKEGQ